MLRPETEPNGTIETANALPLRGGYGIGAGALDPDDQDIWSFIAPAGAKVWILADTGGTQGPGATSRDTVIQLLAVDGVSVLDADDNDGTGTGGDGTIESGLASAIAGRRLPTPGTYFIKVRAASASAIINPYRLFVVTTTLPDRGEVEPNNVVGEATPMGPGLIGLRGGAPSMPDEVDYYSIAATAGDVLFLSADADPDRDGIGDDLAVHLIAPDGFTELIGSGIDSSGTGGGSDPPAESATYTVTTSGTYYVAVRGGGYVLMVAVAPFTEPFPDFDGERRADVSVYRQSTGEWFISRSLDQKLDLIGWGAPSLGDIPLPGDYDGDAKTDAAVFRNSTGEWFLRFSSGGGATIAWGAPSLGDKPMPADYDGDGRTDLAVYRSSTAEWFIRYAAGGTLKTMWGAPASTGLGDIPVTGDFNGDGLADRAVYRTTTGEWFVSNSGAGISIVGWGSPALHDIPVPSDYDGDGRADHAVYRPGTGQWFIRYSAGGIRTFTWGAPGLGDVPVPADFDGDGRVDLAVYRSSTGEWFSNATYGSYAHWGAPALGDIPLSRPAALR